MSFYNLNSNSPYFRFMEDRTKEKELLIQRGVDYIEDIIENVKFNAFCVRIIGCNLTQDELDYYTYCALNDVPKEIIIQQALMVTTAKKININNVKQRKACLGTAGIQCFYQCDYDFLRCDRLTLAPYNYQEDKELAKVFDLIVFGDQQAKSTEEEKERFSALFMHNKENTIFKNYLDFDDSYNLCCAEKAFVMASASEFKNLIEYLNSREEEHLGLEIFDYKSLAKISKILFAYLYPGAGTFRTYIIEDGDRNHIYGVNYLNFYKMEAELANLLQRFHKKLTQKNSKKLDHLSPLLSKENFSTFKGFAGHILQIWQHVNKIKPLNISNKIVTLFYFKILVESLGAKVNLNFLENKEEYKNFEKNFANWEENYTYAPWDEEVFAACPLKDLIIVSKELENKINSATKAFKVTSFSDSLYSLLTADTSTSAEKDNNLCSCPDCCDDIDEEGRVIPGKCCAMVDAEEDDHDLDEEDFFDDEDYVDDEEELDEEEDFDDYLKFLAEEESKLNLFTQDKHLNSKDKQSSAYIQNSSHTTSPNYHHHSAKHLYSKEHNLNQTQNLHFPNNKVEVEVECDYEDSYDSPIYEEDYLHYQNSIKAKKSSSTLRELETELAHASKAQKAYQSVKEELEAEARLFEESIKEALSQQKAARIRQCCILNQCKKNVAQAPSLLTYQDPKQDQSNKTKNKQEVAESSNPTKYNNLNNSKNLTISSPTELNEDESRELDAPIHKLMDNNKENLYSIFSAEKKKEQESSLQKEESSPKEERVSTFANNSLDHLFSTDNNEKNLSTIIKESAQKKTNYNIVKTLQNGVLGEEAISPEELEDARELSFAEFKELFLSNKLVFGKNPVVHAVYEEEIISDFDALENSVAKERERLGIFVKDLEIKDSDDSMASPTPISLANTSLLASQGSTKNVTLPSSPSLGESFSKKDTSSNTSLNATPSTKPEAQVSRPRRDFGTFVSSSRKIVDPETNITISITSESSFRRFESNTYKPLASKQVNKEETNNTVSATNVTSPLSQESLNNITSSVAKVNVSYRRTIRDNDYSSTSSRTNRASTNSRESTSISLAQLEEVKQASITSCITSPLPIGALTASQEDKENFTKPRTRRRIIKTYTTKDLIGEEAWSILDAMEKDFLRKLEEGKNVKFDFSLPSSVHQDYEDVENVGQVATKNIEILGFEDKDYVDVDVDIKDLVNLYNSDNEKLEEFNKTLDEDNKILTKALRKLYKKNKKL